MDAGGISAIVFAILFVIVGVAYGNKLYTEGAFTATDRTASSVDLSFLSLLVLYSPNTLFAYGFIADIMNSKYHYSIASITALFGMVFNKVLGSQLMAGLLQAARGISSLLPKGATTSPAFTSESTSGPLFTGSITTPPVLTGGATSLCSLPGFEWLENKVAPQGIVMSMTVLWYLMIELWDTGAGGQSMTVGIATAVIFLVQWLVLSKNGCLDSYVFSTWSVFTALVMAITFAGTSYGIQKHIPYYTSRNVPPVPSGTPGKFVCPPGTVQSPSGDGCVNKLGPGGKLTSGLGSSETIINVGGSGEKTEAVDDNDQFVCEAYKDGELVTSTIVE